MNTTFRRIVVSGSAAVALLGGAAAITVADAGTASATEMQAHIDRATGAPVNMPDGRTVYVRGLDTAAYRADTGHYTAAVQLASVKTDATPTPGTDGITSGLTPDGGTGAQLQNPVNGTQTGYNQQIQTQAGGGTIAIGIVVILILGIVVFVKVKHSGLKAADAVIGVLFGVAISGTFVGAMASQMTSSLVGSVANALSSLG